MKDRILQLIQHKGLSQAQFANEINIPRASVTHFTTGRNKPSMDVVAKILERYPEVNHKWLIFGIGPMTYDTAAERKPPSANNMPDLFADPGPVQYSSQDRPSPQNTPVHPPKVQAAPENRRETRVEKPQNALKQTVTEHIVVQKAESKNVNKIMLFYSDNTFETFIPEKMKKD